MGWNHQLDDDDDGGDDAGDGEWWWLLFDSLTHLKFTQRGFPWKGTETQKEKDRLPTIIFQGPASGFLKNEDFTVLFQEKTVFFLQDFKPMGPRILFLKRIPSFEKPINLKDYQKTCQPHPRWCREKNGPVPGRWHQEWRQFSGGNRCLKNLVGKGI